MDKNGVKGGYMRRSDNQINFLTLFDFTYLSFIVTPKKAISCPNARFWALTAYACLSHNVRISDSKDNIHYL